MKIIADLHTHTKYSHGKGTVLDNVTTAMIRGLSGVAITDHGPRSAPWIGASLRDFKAMCQEVAALDRRTLSIRVLAGAECNIVSTKGDLDLPNSVRQGLDIVLAGLHPGVLPNSGRDWLTLTGGNWAARISPALRRRARANNTKAVVEAVRRNEIDVVTHPGYHLDIDTVELARACAARDTAMEINARHQEMTAEYCRAAAREGASFVINSDAHRPEDVGNVTRGLAVARAAGLTADQVKNSDGGDLFDWLEQKRTGRQGPARGWADWTEQPPLDRQRALPRRPEGGARGGGRSYWTDWSNQGKIH